MASFCAETRVLDLCLLYFGPVGAGARTNLLQLSRGMGDGSEPALTEDGSRYSVQLNPLQLGVGEGILLRVEACSVGTAEGARESLLSSVDGMVFVADAQRNRLRDNLIAWADLLEGMRRTQRCMSDLATVFQINKVDLQEAMSAGDVDSALNSESYPSFPGVATMGRGVGMCFSELTRRAVGRVAATLDLASQGIPRGGLSTALDSALVAAGAEAGRRLREVLDAEEAAASPGEATASSDAVPASPEGGSGQTRRGVDASRSAAPTPVVEPLVVEEVPPVEAEGEAEAPPGPRCVKPSAERSRQLQEGVEKCVRYLQQALGFIERRSEDEALHKVLGDGRAVARYLDRVADELAAWTHALEFDEASQDCSSEVAEETLRS